MNGRETERASLGGDHRGIRFRDGEPADAENAQPPAIYQAIRSLLSQLPSEAGTCVADSKANAKVAGCTKCQLDCRETRLKCSAAALSASLECGSLAPTCYLKAASTCDAALQRCFQTCKRSGPCCPDYCKGAADCCDKSWGCCPPPASTTPADRRDRREDERRRQNQTWSTAWPTCPRCGPPVVAVAPPERPNPRPPTNRRPDGYVDPPRQPAPTSTRRGN